MIHNPKLYIKLEGNAYWYFNINQEQEWNTTSVFPSVTSIHQLELVKQQEQQLLFLANCNDTVFFRHCPDLLYLEYLKQEGMELPIIKILGDYNSLPIEQFEKSVLIPYINTEALLEKAKVIPNLEILGSDPELIKRINNKFITRRYCEDNGFKVTQGFFCDTPEQLRKAYSELRTQGFEKCVLKIPYGSSGKGLRVINNEDSFEILLKFIIKRKLEFNLLIEGWYSVKQNINCQLWIGEDEPQILAITEQAIDNNGVYLGTNFSPAYEDYLLKSYRKEMIRLGNLLKKKGYYGICGIDSIIDETKTLFPVIEINARFTQVTYLLPLVEKLLKEYRYVQSSFVRFDTSESVGFQEIYSLLKKKINPDERNKFIIYTYAFHKLPDQNKTIYRIFSLFYGVNCDKVQEMNRLFNTFNGSIKV